MTLRTGLATVLVALVLAFAGGGAARAVEPDEILKDARLEARARALSVELRCLVCQNQSIDDSNAPLARDLRLIVRERLLAGDSDAQVRDFLVARYGTFVLLKPPLNLGTLVLWLTPLVMLGLAVVVLRRRFFATAGAAGQPAPLSADEERRLAGVLAEAPPERAPPR